MTNDDKRLVRYLSFEGEADWNDACVPIETCRLAADRIEALSAEVERLREALMRWRYSGCPDCSGDCGSANPPVLSCIMLETRAALGEQQ